MAELEFAVLVVEQWSVGRKGAMGERAGGTPCRKWAAGATTSIQQSAYTYTGKPGDGSSNPR
jgi:hypothetical protein